MASTFIEQTAASTEDESSASVTESIDVGLGIAEVALLLLWWLMSNELSRVLDLVGSGSCDKIVDSTEILGSFVGFLGDSDNEKFVLDGGEHIGDISPSSASGGDNELTLSMPLSVSTMEDGANGKRVREQGLTDGDCGLNCEGQVFARFGTSPWVRALNFSGLNLVRSLKRAVLGARCSCT